MSGSDITVDATRPDTMPGRRSEQTLVRGSKLGRYEILEELGRGAMGIVYAAYDPELDRDVALKVIIGDASTNAKRARDLIKEARTLAQLSCPYVITLYGAEVVDGTPFVAMELVDGVTLSDWVARDEPSQREIIKAFVDVARGLTAIHEAGLVHHDVKPANLIVSRDGSVRVADFGLARGATQLNRALTAEQARTITIDEDPEPEPEAPAGLRGTPAYMAPELWAHQRATPATDQFAFFVSLFELLLGRRPFPGREPAQIVSSQATGDLGDLSSLPRRLESMLRRGLSRDPADRFSSMAEVEQALLGTRRHRGRFIIGTLALAMLGLPTAALLDSPAKCAWTNAANEDALVAETRQTLAALDVDDATFARQATRTFIDNWSSAILTGYSEVCTVEDSQRAQAMSVCLGRSLVEGRTVMEALRVAEPNDLDDSIAALYELPDPRRCAQPFASEASDPPEDGEEVASLTRELARLRADFRLHRKDLLPRAQELHRKAVELDRTRPEIDALLLLSQLYFLDGDLDTAEAMALEALELADATEAHDLAASAAGRVVWAVGFGRRDLVRGEQYARLAIAHATKVDGLTLALHERILGVVRRMQGDLDEAQTLGYSAVVRLEQAPHCPQLFVAQAYGSLAATLSAAGDLDGARVYAEATLELYSALYGPGHPDVIRALTELANIDFRLSDYEAAVVAYRDLLRRQRAVRGDDELQLAQTWLLLSGALGELQDWPEAIMAAERALGIRSKRLGDHHPSTAEAEYTLGMTLLSMDRHAEAEPRLRAAYVTMSAADPEHPSVIMFRTALIGVLEALGRDTEARPLAEANGSLAKRFPDAPLAAHALLQRARLRLRDDHPGALDDARAVIDALHLAPEPQTRQDLERWAEMNGLVLDDSEPSGD